MVTGGKNQFRDMRTVRGKVVQMLKQIPKKSWLLYFGDASNPKKPDIGLLFTLVKKLRPDIIIKMIQINEAKNWGVPTFVTKPVYWHNDYTKSCKWGGIDPQGNPCSNTKQWLRLKKNIQKIFVFGGGPITLQEYHLAQKYNIPCQYYAVDRKFKGDGKTKVKKQDSIQNRIGITYKLDYVRSRSNRSRKSKKKLLRKEIISNLIVQALEDAKIPKERWGWSSKAEEVERNTYNRYSSIRVAELRIEYAKLCKRRKSKKKNVKG